MNWPATLVESVARGDFILFVGSGVSASARNRAGASPPTWRDLLTRAAECLPLLAARKRVVKACRYDLLDAAERLVFEASAAGRLADVNQFIARAVDGPDDDRFVPSSWHQTLMRLSPRLVVTTNYDRLLEREAPGGFAVLDYESGGLERAIRLNEPTLLHVHGSVDAPDKIVLSQSNYVDLARTFGRTLRSLEAALQTRTCLFVGYSLTDPDIRMLLSAVARNNPEEPAHYMLTGRRTVETAHQSSLMLRKYGVGAVEHRNGDFPHALDLLVELADLVDPQPV